MNTAKRINLLRLTSGSVFWQRNYWEHIIRNDAELNRIRQYIETNPVSVDLSRRDWLGLD
jgi:putative transposase